MTVVRGYRALHRSIARPVVTIGNFDGVHLGHREILSLVTAKARQRGGVSVALTFRPHPQAALRPETRLQLLTTYDEKIRLLEEAGIDLIIEEPFSREFSSIGPERFFNDILLKALSAESVVVGYDFAFGRGREGQLEVLGSLCRDAGIELTVVQPRKIGGEVVSSSRIRQYLSAGDVGGAARLLGREFLYRGVVVRGEGRGRKLGFPTANLQLEDKLMLPYGVYATRASWADRQAASVTNVGVRPTFQGPPGVGEIPALIETHVIGETIDLYGSALEIRFVRRLREERKFPSVEALKAQIATDASEAARILTGSSP